MNAIVEFKPVANWDDASALLQQIHNKFSAIPIGEIKDDLARVDVANALREAKTLTKRLKDVGVSLKAPAKAYIAEIDAMLTPSAKVLEQVEMASSNAILAYDRVAIVKRQEVERKKAEDERQRLEEEAIEAELNGSKLEAAVINKAAEKVVAPVVVNLQREIGAGVTIRKVKKWRLVDESKVPREFLTINSVMVNAACKSGKPVDGIEYYEDETTVTRGAY